MLGAQVVDLVWFVAMEIDRDDLEVFFGFMFDHLDEKQRRVLVEGVAQLLGHSGKTIVADV